MRQLAETHMAPGPAPDIDLEPVSAFEALTFAGRAIGAHEEQLAGQYGAKAVSRALESISVQVNGLEDKMRPYREQAIASTVRFAPADRDVVLQGLAYVDTDGMTNATLDNSPRGAERRRARQANRKLASMVLRQFTEGGDSSADALTGPLRTIRSDETVGGANAQRVLPTAANRPAGGPGRHRRTVDASRPTGRPSASHAPRHARAGAFSASRVLSGAPIRRGLGLRRRVRS